MDGTAKGQTTIVAGIRILFLASLRPAFRILAMLLAAQDIDAHVWPLVPWLHEDCSGLRAKHIGERRSLHPTLGGLSPPSAGQLHGAQAGLCSLSNKKQRSWRNRELQASSQNDDGLWGSSAFDKTSLVACVLRDFVHQVLPLLPLL